MVTSRSGPSMAVPFWVSLPMHKASLATYSMERLQLATSLICSCLTIKWRQHTFFGWFWRSNRRWTDSTFTLSYLPYPTWESVLVSLVPRNQSSWHRGKKKKTQLEMERLCVLKWVKVAQSCLTLCNPMDYTVPGILQAKILVWVAFPFPRGSSQPRDGTQVSHIADGVFTSWATREAPVLLRAYGKSYACLSMVFLNPSLFFTIVWIWVQGGGIQFSR